MVSNFVRLPATEIPLGENSRKQFLNIGSHRRARRSRTEELEVVERRAEGASETARTREDSVLALRVAGLRKTPLFRGLSDSELDEIANAAEEVRFSRRETIFQQDDPVQFVYLIVAGTVKVTQLSEGGKEVILRLDRRGSLIDDLADASQVHASTAQAIHPCSVLAWDASAFEDFATQIPAIYRNAVGIMLGRLRMIEERFCDVTTQRVPQRLARLLIHLAGQTTQGALDPVGLSREELSQMTGTSLFTVSRLLSLWAEMDILTVDRKAVLIESLPRLLRIAQAVAA